MNYFTVVAALIGVVITSACAPAGPNDPFTSHPDRPATAANQPPPKQFDSANEPSVDREVNLDLAPTTGPTDLPGLGRDGLPDADQRWTNPEAQARHRRLMDELWTTTLGQMYLGYLTEDVPATAVTGRAKQLMTRLLRDSAHVGKRMRLVEKLSLDLYARGRLTEDVAKRVLLLKMVFDARDLVGKDQSGLYAIDLMLLSAGIAFANGSGVFRRELKNGWRRLIHRCRGRACPELVGNFAELRSVRALRESYDYGRAGGTVMALGGGLTMWYSLGLEKLPGWRRFHDKDDELLNGRDELLDQSDY